jgi:hypothetical protein
MITISWVFPASHACSNVCSHYATFLDTFIIVLISLSVYRLVRTDCSVSNQGGQGALAAGIFKPGTRGD